MRSRAASGFTLAEVLVGMLLLAMGVMGALAMQGKAQRSRLESALLSQALHLAGSLGERMQANPLQLDKYLSYDYDAGRDGAPRLPGRLCFDGSDCNTAQLVDFDLFEASQLLYASFPAGRISICHDGKVVDADALSWACDGNGDAPVTIKVGWEGRRGADAPNNSAPRLALPLPVRSAP
jgi:type IV pilus assembly protein PilV